MIYKVKKIKDWAFVLDWIMVAILVYLLLLVIPTLEFDGWGYDSFFMHKVLFLGLGYCVFRLYINQSRMYKIMRDEINDLDERRTVE